MYIKRVYGFVNHLFELVYNIFINYCRFPDWWGSLNGISTRDTLASDFLLFMSKRLNSVWSLVLCKDDLCAAATLLECKSCFAFIEGN